MCQSDPTSALTRGLGTALFPHLLVSWRRRRRGLLQKIDAETTGLDRIGPSFTEWALLLLRPSLPANYLGLNVAV